MMCYNSEFIGRHAGIRFWDKAYVGGSEMIDNEAENFVAWVLSGREQYFELTV